jgi:hypothetical protein
VVLALSLITVKLIENEFSCCNSVMKLERREVMSTERVQMGFLIGSNWPWLGLWSVCGRAKSRSKRWDNLALVADKSYIRSW